MICKKNIYTFIIIIIQVSTRCYNEILSRIFFYETINEMFIYIPINKITIC